MKNEFDKNRGITSDPLKQKLLWNYASAHGVTNEQAVQILAYMATVLHNKMVDNPSLRDDFQPLIQSMFKCFPIARATEIAVWVGMNVKVEENKPHFLDDVMKRVEADGLNIPVSFDEHVQALNRGFN